MAPPLELDYIGLAEVCYSLGNSPEKLAGGEVEHHRETELRLGLPGFRSPDRNEKVGLTLDLLPPRGFAFGAKRVFSDAIHGNAKWVFTDNGGSEAEQEKPGSGSGTSAGAGKGAAGTAAVAPETKPPGPPAAKAQVVGWPPIRSHRKNSMATTNPSKNKDDGVGKQGICLYVKVSMDGAPYLRKVDLRTYSSYKELSSDLEKMFSGFTTGQCGSHGIPAREGISESCLMALLNGTEYVLTYEDKDGDWMLVGDVPWE
ncbi:Auxin-responsive protein IAA27 [Apostasia shenzhenica]|uniref:Auxin-responsive protein n=1 Tax=Apostasia shenzhenica TaxID=1088818 RepID=A0A2I0BAD0_9ASPA|nr:Auxin-responsive protein IAA27 [Apostasia shenzhenica]